MKPSVDDQLRQTRRVLLDEVLPAVESEHAAGIVRRLAADLRKLSTCWEAAIPFARWEVETLESVLARITGQVPDGADAESYAALCERAEVLRSELSDALRRMPAPQEAPQEWRIVLEYFDERLARDPMTNRMPGTDG